MVNSSHYSSLNPQIALLEVRNSFTPTGLKLTTVLTKIHVKSTKTHITYSISDHPEVIIWVQKKKQPGQLHFNYTDGNLKLQNSDVRKTNATQINPNSPL